MKVLQCHFILSHIHRLAFKVRRSLSLFDRVQSSACINLLIQMFEIVLAHPVHNLCLVALVSFRAQLCFKPYRCFVLNRRIHFVLDLHLCCFCPSLLSLLQHVHFDFLVEDFALGLVHTLDTQHFRNFLLLWRGLFAPFVLVWSHYLVCYYLVAVEYGLFWGGGSQELYRLFDASVSGLNPFIVDCCPFIVKFL